MPVFFNGTFDDTSRLTAAVLAMVVMTLAASAVYCFNDVVDADADRRHPKKNRRPVARRLITERQACVFGTILAIASVVLAAVVLPLPYAVAIIVAYFGINALYIVRLKHIPIVDCLAVASGFVLRILLGSVATNVVPTPWLISLTATLAVFLCLGKRRADITATRRQPRSPLYHVRNLDRILIAMVIVNLALYAAYTMSPDVTRRMSPYVILTIIYVAVGILRYLYIVTVARLTAPPTSILLHDNVIRISVVLWLIHFSILIYVR